MTIASQKVWRFVTVAGMLAIAFWTLCVWNKHDFCRGWADHYAARAIQLRAEAANPALAPAEAAEYLVAADLHEVVSRKYKQVAWQPWRPYPGYPLVTTEEMRRATENHAEPQLR